VRDALLHIKDAPSEEAAQFLSDGAGDRRGAGQLGGHRDRAAAAILANLPGLYIAKKNSAADFPAAGGTGRTG
jgi:hypothetical protein